MNIPEGTTHVELAREIDYCQRPTFMKWGYDFTGPESGTRYDCWYIWHSYKHYCDWAQDYGYQKPKDDPNRLITVKEYKERLLLNI